MTNEEAIAELKAQEEHLRGMSIMGREAYYMAIEALKQPKRKKGKWIDTRDYCGEFSCSNCNETNINNFYNYCPHCGAKMEVEK